MRPLHVKSPVAGVIVRLHEAKLGADSGRQREKRAFVQALQFARSEHVVEAQARADFGGGRLRCRRHRTRTISALRVVNGDGRFCMCPVWTAVLSGS